MTSSFFMQRAASSCFFWGGMFWRLTWFLKEGVCQISKTLQDVRILSCEKMKNLAGCEASGRCAKEGVCQISKTLQDVRILSCEKMKNLAGCEAKRGMDANGKKNKNPSDNNQNVEGS